MNVGHVALVGAGPGHPGLLTLRAVECLRQADFILYDRLVPQQMLEHACEQATRVCVEELAACHAERWPLIHQLMIDKAREGLRVVRLKGGDPMVFGRGAEEAEALREAGIEYEIVPGVTAALGMASCAGIPLTHRQYASALAIVTGHEEPGKSGSLLDWSALARFPGTLVFYMGIARAEAIVGSLLEHGKCPQTPAAVVERATTPRQRTIISPLEEIPIRIRSEKIEAPALIVIGEVVAVRERIAWLESHPLFGTTVLVTRPRHQAMEMVRQIEARGGRGLVLPVMEICDPADWGPVDEALERLQQIDWLVFTSSNGVQAFMKRLLERGRDLRALGNLQLAAIGPATAQALRSYHLEADLLPESFNSEGLVAQLREKVIGRRVLLARADRGLDLLREELSKVAQVEQIAVYSQRDTILGTTSTVLEALRRGEVDYISLTSSNIARGLLRGLDQETQMRIRRGEILLVSISPRTSAAVREMGFEVAGEATEYTTSGVVEVICQMASARKKH